MAKQNIFDNETFFEGYKAIRNREGNANDLFEIPALFSLLPNLKGTSVLDLGCGFGEHCVEFVNKGASKVVGIDISEKMLEVAKKEHSNPAITYMLLPIEDIGTHSFRKFFATEIYKNNDYNIVLVQQLLQHSSVAITQRYIGISSEMQERALQGHINLI